MPKKPITFSPQPPTTDNLRHLQVKITNVPHGGVKLLTFFSSAPRLKKLVFALSFNHLIGFNHVV